MNAPTVDQLRPMLPPDATVKAFTDPAWLYELKFDGYRCLAGIEGGQVDLRSKAGKNCTAAYPEVVKALAKLPGSHVIDGELCVIGEDGVSDFNRFQTRARRRRWYPGCDPVTLCVFDVLVCDGVEVIGLPLIERKALLKKLLAGVDKNRVLFVGDLPADEKLLTIMVGAGLKIEGVVAKRKDSVYLPGERTTAWRKIKRAGWQEGRRWTNR